MSNRVNESGVAPFRYGLIVKPEKVEEKTQGGIILPEQSTEREQFRQSRGVVVAIGELAFTMGSPANKDEYWEDRVRPREGSVVLYKEYNGQSFIGNDDERYVFLKDSELLGVEIDE